MKVSASRSLFESSEHDLDYLCVMQFTGWFRSDADPPNSLTSYEATDGSRKIGLCSLSASDRSMSNARLQLQSVIE